MPEQGTKHGRSDTVSAVSYEDIRARLEDTPPHTLKNYVLANLAKPTEAQPKNALDFFDLQLQVQDSVFAVTVQEDCFPGQGLNLDAAPSPPATSHTKTTSLLRQS